MIQAAEFDSLNLLKQAILDTRNAQFSPVNKNPSVQLHLVERFGESYEAYIHWHPFDKCWILGVGFNGLSNQGKPYWSSLGAKRFTTLDTLLVVIRSWIAAGPQRINYATHKWLKVND